jgi:hypothetical protein
MGEAKRRKAQPAQGRFGFQVGFDDGVILTIDDRSADDLRNVLNGVRTWDGGPHKEYETLSSQADKLKFIGEVRAGIAIYHDNKDVEYSAMAVLVWCAFSHPVGGKGLTSYVYDEMFAGRTVRVSMHVNNLGQCVTTAGPDFIDQSDYEFPPLVTDGTGVTLRVVAQENVQVH